MKIPFSAYDFFGYLASGFLVLAAVDFGFEGGWLLRENHAIAYGVFWTFVAYVAGHVIAHLSSWLLEHSFLRGALRSCEETLFEDKPKTRWAKLFPGYYKPFPKETRERVLEKAKKLAGIDKPSRGLFFHCHPIAMAQPAAKERLASFLNLYGFCRNVSMAFLLTAAALLIAAVYHLDFDPMSFTTASASRFWWFLAAVASAVGMFYRYLKFFKHYTEEVFRAYAEAPPPSQKPHNP